MAYTVIEEPMLQTTLAPQDKSVLKWVPMSINALGYDIREVWRRSDEAWTFGGIGFSR